MFLEAGCFFDANRKSLNIRKFLMDRKIDTQLFRVIELGVMGYIVTYYVNTSQNNQALKKFGSVQSGQCVKFNMQGCGQEMVMMVDVDFKFLISKIQVNLYCFIHLNYCY